MGIDASALIFVALAVAWAAYLLPLALKHHDEDARGRTVDRFSHRLRVLARREPVDKRTARLVTPGAVAADDTADVPVVSKVELKAQRKPAKAEPVPAPAAAPAAPLTPAQLRARRAAAKRATARRRNVLAVLLAATLVVVGLAAFRVIAWPYVAIPLVLLAAWLVACRLMVKGEQQALAPARRPAAAPAAEPVVQTQPEVEVKREVEVEPEVEAPEAEEIDPMEDTSAGITAVVDPAMWDPVPVTLPTYVTKPAATRRTVRTIDLDATGVWTSGRTDADAQLAREADAADKKARERRDGDDQRAVGS